MVAAQPSRKRKAAQEATAGPSSSKRQKATPASTSLAAAAQQQPSPAPVRRPQDPAKWWRGDVDPAPVGAQCPVDWSLAGLKDIPPMLKDVYLMRSPWKERSDFSNPEVAEALNQKHSQELGTEAWRKKFMKANNWVFKATGQWWERMVIGLEEVVGRPEKKNRKKEKAKKKRAPAKKYHGDTFTLYIQDPTEATWLEEREIPIEIARQASPIFANAISTDQYAIVLKTTAQVADIFLSCFAPHRRTTLPHFGHRMIQDEDGTFFYIEFPTNITFANLFDLYVFSSGIQSDDICDMIIDEWRNIFQREQQLREEFRTGMRRWTDIPAGPIPNILDFEPKHINSLFDSHYVDDNDRALMFWLDAIVLKGEPGYQKIKDDLGDYCDDFIEHWRKRLPTEQRAEIDHLYATTRDQSTSSSTTCNSSSQQSIADITDNTTSRSTTPATEAQDAANQEDIIESIETGPQNQVHNVAAQSYRVKEESPSRDSNQEPAPSHKDNAPTATIRFATVDDAQAELDRVQHAIAEANRLASQQASTSGDEDEDVEEEAGAAESIEDTSGSEYTESELPHHDPTLILAGSEPDICTTYHNHTRLGQSCYKATIPPPAHKDSELDAAHSNTSRPVHHIRMTIDGVPGFIIQNHTGYSKSDFQALPTCFPEWDWERVRAVNCYEQREKNDHEYGRDPHPLILPSPVYFNEGYTGALPHPYQDGMGRWPSHPGYRNPRWGEDEEDFEDTEMLDNPLPDDDDDGESVFDDGHHDDDDEEEEEEVDEQEPQHRRRGRKSKRDKDKDDEPKQERWKEILFDRQADPYEEPTAPIFSRSGYGFDGYGMHGTRWS